MMNDTIDASILGPVYSERSPGAHKGDFGHLFVIGGSFRYTGAPVLVALAALRSGVDRVTVAAPRRAADRVASFAPDIITIPLEGGVLAPENVGPLTKELDAASAIVIGNGLGRADRTLRAVGMMLEAVDVPLVIDADALYAIAEHPALLDGQTAVLIPHREEFRALTGLSLMEDAPSRHPEQVYKQAKELSTTILLKAHHDVVSDGADVAINETGTPLMTVGGTGDVLAGVVGALLARGVEPVVAASCAAFITGRAGELAGAEYDEGLMASDLLSYIPQVIQGEA